MRRELRLIAGALNDSEILWCVGGSLLLQQYGLAEHPRDIDLLVALPDAERAAGILGAMGEAAPCGQSPTYSTEFFRRFLIGGCDADLMSGFRVNHPEGRYEYLFDSASVASVRVIDGAPIPFAALEDWYVVYQLIPGKERKTLRIEEYFRQNGIEHPLLLERALMGCLPETVRKRIAGLTGN